MSRNDHGLGFPVGIDMNLNLKAFQKTQRVLHQSSGVKSFWSYSLALRFTNATWWLSLANDTFQTFLYFHLSLIKDSPIFQALKRVTNETYITNKLPHTSVNSLSAAAQSSKINNFQSAFSLSRNSLQTVVWTITFTNLSGGSGTKWCRCC